MPTAMDPGTLAAWNALVASWDVWLLTFVLTVVVPTVGRVRFRRLHIRDGVALPARAKIALYLKIIGWQWFLVVALWLVLKRHGLSFGAIGEHLGDARLTLGVTGALVVLLTVVFTIVRWRLGRARNKTGSPGSRDRMQAITPAFGREMWVFGLVSLTAGICEELLYRGWLLNLLRVATGSVWIAVGVGTVVFGVAHAYQGVKGVLRAGFVGLQLAVLFVYVGSLIPGQALHTGADLATAFLMAIAASRNSANLRRSTGPNAKWA